MKKIFLILVLFMFSLPVKAEISREEIDAYLEQHPEVVADIMQKYEQQQREQAEKEAENLMIKYKNQLNSEANAPFVGPKNAKVTVVEFFDFSCGYCKKLSGAIEKVVADNADVKFVFKPVAFVSPTSKYQAKAGMAAYVQGKFMEFYKEVMASGGSMNEADVDAVAAKIGLNMDKYKTDLASSTVSSALDDISTLVRNIQINGVPTIFVNAENIHATNSDAIQEAIDAAKAAVSDDSTDNFLKKKR